MYNAVEPCVHKVLFWQRGVLQALHAQEYTCPFWGTISWRLLLRTFHSAFWVSSQNEPLKDYSDAFWHAMGQSCNANIFSSHTGIQWPRLQSDCHSSTQCSRVLVGRGLP